MFMQVFIKCGRLLHYEQAYVKYFRENSAHRVGEIANVLCEARGNVFVNARHRAALWCFRSRSFFHADFVSLASEHPPIDVPEPGRMAGAAAMPPHRNQVA